MIRLRFPLLVISSLLISLASFSSCVSKWERKLSEEKLESLFAELYTSQYLFSKSYTYSDDTLRLAYRNQLFDKYKITATEFDSIVAYYSHYKADRLAIILDKASEKVLQEKDRYENLASLSTDSEEELKEELISAEELPSLIPEKTYPTLRLLTPNGTVECYSASFLGIVPKGSTFKAKLVLKGIRSTQPNETPHVRLLIGFDNEHTTPQEEEVDISDKGEYSVVLTTEKEASNAHFTLLLYVPDTMPSALLYIEQIVLEYIGGMGENEQEDRLDPMDLLPNYEPDLQL